MSSSYINSPKTPREHLDNCRFQLENVQGWIGAAEDSVALIKARCLLRETELLIAALSRAAATKEAA